MTNILQDLNWRYAVKKFDPNKKLESELVEELIQTFILTPSSLGLQPWKLVYVTDMEKRKQMAPFCWNDSQILESTGVFILTRNTDISDTLVDNYIEYIMSISGAPRSSLEGYENMMKTFLSGMDTDQKIAWAERQVMIALGNMMTVCAIRKIDSCPIEGFQRDKIDEILDLEAQNLASVVLLPVGYRDENDEHLQRGKVRYTKEMMFKEV